jgi:hypothetical protein
MEGHTMERGSRHTWAVALIGGLLLMGAAAVAYNVGLSQGMAQVPVPAGSVLPAYAYGWHRPWGWGFGLLPPLFLIGFWLLAIRALAHRRPWGPGSYGPPPFYRDSFDEWHRQAHERMSGSGAAPGATHS